MNTMEIMRNSRSIAELWTYVKPFETMECVKNNDTNVKFGNRLKVEMYKQL